MKYLVALLVLGCTCPAALPPPKMLRLESYADCAKGASEFCDRNFSPSRDCWVRMVEEFCQ